MKKYYALISTPDFTDKIDGYFTNIVNPFPEIAKKFKKAHDTLEDFADAENVSLYFWWSKSARDAAFDYGFSDEADFELTGADFVSRITNTLKIYMGRNPHGYVGIYHNHKWYWLDPDAQDESIWEDTGTGIGTLYRTTPSRLRGLCRSIPTASKLINVSAQQGKNIVRKLMAHPILSQALIG